MVHMERSDVALVSVTFFLAIVQACCGEQVCSHADAEAGASLLQVDHGQNPTLVSKQFADTGMNQSISGVGEAANPWLELTSRLSMQREGSQGMFCRSHPCSLVLAESDTRRGVGQSAPLTEQGYQEVAKLKDDAEMTVFIKRLVARFDCEVVEEGGVTGFAPWFSGTTSVQNLHSLEEALLFELLTPGNRWIVYKNSAGFTGDSASLDLNGYVVVACLRSDEDMKKFTRRLCKDMGVKITDEGGFDGMIKFFSGTTSFQSLERLKSEIQSAAAAPHTWAEQA